MSVLEATAVIRSAAPGEGPAIYALISAHLAEGHLLPRELDEIAHHAGRFVVAEDAGRLVACADLLPLTRAVGEVRSLVVNREARSSGVGRRILDELVDRATRAGFETLCAFTHAPSYFVHLGFSIVPHVWVPEKIVTDCHHCPHFRRCGQYAVVRPLQQARQTCVPLASLHG